MSTDDIQTDLERIYIRILDTVIERLKTDQTEEPWNSGIYDDLLNKINHIRIKHENNLSDLLEEIYRSY